MPSKNALPAFTSVSLISRREGQISRRRWFRGVFCSATWALTAAARPVLAAPSTSRSIAEETFAFVQRCAQPDGGYAPSPDPSYMGNSDTGSSDLAAVTYAAT